MPSILSYCFLNQQEQVRRRSLLSPKWLENAWKSIERAEMPDFLAHLVMQLVRALARRTVPCIPVVLLDDDVICVNFLNSMIEIRSWITLTKSSKGSHSMQHWKSISWGSLTSFNQSSLTNVDNMQKCFNDKKEENKSSFAAPTVL